MVWRIAGARVACLWLRSYVVPAIPARTQVPTLCPTAPPPQDGKFELGKLRGGKQDDITVICAYVLDESAH